MELHRILDKDACTLDLREKTKDDVLRGIAQIASEARACENVTAEQIFDRLDERERQGSTGFGEGIAIPHARVPGMSDFLLFIVTSRKGVEFDAVDKKKVHILFVLLGPDERVADHLQILAVISRVLSNSNVRREILAARSKTGIYESFVRNIWRVEGEKGVVRAMKALFVILYEEELLYAILELFVEEGIQGATIIESSGMGEYISSVPVFASFIGFMNQSKNRSKTIVAMVPEDRVQEIITGIEEITGDLDKKEGAMVFALDVPFYKGTMKIM